MDRNHIGVECRVIREKGGYHTVSSCVSPSFLPASLDSHSCCFASPVLVDEAEAELLLPVIPGTTRGMAMRFEDLVQLVWISGGR